MIIQRPTTTANALAGPDFISLQVHDLEASKRFYIEHLGLAPMRQSPPPAVVFDTEPVPFAIRSPLVDLKATDRLGWGVSIWFACDDADTLHGAMSKAGVPMITPLSDSPFGRVFTFRDPDGYAITVHTARRAPRSTTMDPSAGYLTLINTFSVEPDRADQLLDQLWNATEQTIRHLPGFVSANLHISQDRHRVANYAQWRSRADYDAILTNPEVQVHMREAAAIARSFDPVFYDLCQTRAAGPAS